MEAEIKDLIQRIDVSTLLKEIDVEEMRLQSNNNMMMNKLFKGLLNKWEDIQRGEENK
jgi:hypothetical protein